MDTPESLFADITMQTAQEFVRDSRAEDLYVDFKTVQGTEMSRDDRKNFSKAMSGFANSAGGVIVWGIDARPNAEGVDCAVGVSLVPDVSKFLAQLNQMTGTAVSPMVEGVRHRGLISDGSSGIVLTLVPVSASGPHMAKAGEDRYYKRSGSSLYKMEHFDLEDMFGRRRRPSLGLSYTVSEQGSSGARYNGRVTLTIQNSGRALARCLYLSVTPKGPYTVNQYGVDGNRNEGLPRLLSQDRNTIRFGAGDTIVLHPESELPVCALYLDIAIDAESQVTLPAPLVVEYSLCADGLRMSRGTLEISGLELANAILPQRFLPPKIAP